MIEHEINVDAQRIICWISLSLMVTVIALQLYIRSLWENASRHAFFFACLMSVYIVHAAHTVSHLARSYGWPSCTWCRVWLVYGRVLYVLSRIITYFFFLQRAKMSQNLAPVASEKCFKYYYPAILLFMWIAFTFGATDNNMNSMAVVQCLVFHAIDYCEYRPGATSVVTIIGPIVEIANSATLLYLFVQPFLIFSRQQNVNESPQLRQMIGNRLRWNIGMSAINLVSTNMILIGWKFISFKFEYCWPLDRTLNVLTSFLMLRKNREWLASNASIALRTFTSLILRREANQGDVQIQAQIVQDPISPKTFPELQVRAVTPLRPLFEHTAVVVDSRIYRSSVELQREQTLSLS